MLCTEPPALVDTPIVNCCYIRAGRCRAVRTERSRPTGNVSLVWESDCVVGPVPPGTQCCARTRGWGKATLRV